VVTLRLSYKGWKLFLSTRSYIPFISPCDFPIRDGNFSTGVENVPFSFPCDFPIRDGNNTFSDGPTKKYSPCDFPIRDGNSLLRDLVSFAHRTLRLSYKGWKPERLMSASRMPVALRLSYKGWKLRSGWTVSGRTLPLATFL